MEALASGRVFQASKWGTGRQGWGWNTAWVSQPEPVSRAETSHQPWKERIPAHLGGSWGGVLPSLLLGGIRHGPALPGWGRFSIWGVRHALKGHACPSTPTKASLDTKREKTCSKAQGFCKHLRRQASCLFALPSLHAGHPRTSLGESGVCLRSQGAVATEVCAYVTPTTQA